MYARVIVDIAHSNVDRLFTYEIPEGLEVLPGHRVTVPFGAGNKPLEGFVLEVSDSFEGEGVKLKSVSRTLEPYVALTREQIRLAYWIAEWYHCLLVDALRLMIPALSVAKMNAWMAATKASNSVMMKPPTKVTAPSPMNA